MSWAEGRYVGFDLESTDKDPLTAHIIQAAVVHVAAGHRPRPIQWLVDPGCEVPPKATEIHGWTRARILEEVGGEGMAVRATKDADGQWRKLRMTVDGALGEVAGHLGVAMHTDTPVVIQNAAYDTTLLELELARVGVDTLASRPTGIRGIVDPGVIEKNWDPFRRVCYKAPGCNPADDDHDCGGCRGRSKFACGGCGATNRKLVNLCRHYGVRLTGAHNAVYDALAAVRVAQVLATLDGTVARWKLGTLHQHQVTWRREQSDSLRDFWTRTGNPAAAEVDSGWPLHSSLTSTLTGASA